MQGYALGLHCDFALLGFLSIDLTLPYLPCPPFLFHLYLGYLLLFGPVGRFRIVDKISMQAALFGVFFGAGRGKVTGGFEEGQWRN